MTDQVLYDAVYRAASKLEITFEQAVARLVEVCDTEKLQEALEPSQKAGKVKLQYIEGRWQIGNHNP